MARKCLVSRGHKIIVSLWVLLFSGVCSLKSAKNLHIMKVSTVAGRSADLPCNTNLPNSSDELHSIVWYKNHTPICSYDYRIEDSAAYWVSDVLGERASWVAAEPSTLQIHHVIPTDRGIYRCRVDFKITPSKNYFYLLDVVELPSMLKIFDGLDKEVAELAGPYFENTSLQLICVVKGGNPVPRLRWWRNNKEITQLNQVDGASVSELKLWIPRLSRSHYENLYSCSAENTDLVPPLKRLLLIYLYLPPLSVQILPTDVPFAVQQTHNTACRTVGARPPAFITWSLGHAILNSSEETISENHNETFSILRWTPQMENNGQLLKCRASHTVLSYGTIETSLTVDLQYPPIVFLRLSFGPYLEELEIGSNDIYFECDVQAKPPPYKIVWKRNDQLITYNPKEGIITGTTAGSGYLALQKALKNHTGVYTCTVSNVEGDTKSNPISLQITHKPECEFTGIAVVAAIRNKETKITCSTYAYPKPNFFQWSIHNSSGMYNIESDKFTVENGSSTLSFTTTDKADYGKITCKATNRAGQQVEPCQYVVINAVKPEIISQCSVKEVNNDLEVQCIAGNSGGLNTTHVLEVWESGDLLMKLPNQSPDWKFNCPNTEKDLKLIVYSYNAVGRSENSYLTVKKRLKSQLPTEPNSINEISKVTWVLGIGLTGLAIVVPVIAIIIAKKRYSQQAHTSDTDSTNGIEMTPKILETSKSCPDIYKIDAQLSVPDAQDTMLASDIGTVTALPRIRQIVTEDRHV